MTYLWPQLGLCPICTVCCTYRWMRTHISTYIYVIHIYMYVEYVRGYLSVCLSVWPVLGICQAEQLPLPLLLVQASKTQFIVARRRPLGESAHTPSLPHSLPCLCSPSFPTTFYSFWFCFSPCGYLFLVRTADFAASSVSLGPPLNLSVSFSVRAPWKLKIIIASTLAARKSLSCLLLHPQHTPKSRHRNARHHLHWISLGATKANAKVKSE